MSGGTQRRLVAIVSADVAGYTSLMRGDEEGTLARLKAMRDSVVAPLVNEYGGRIVKLVGDGILIEFASAVDAVRSAAEIQRLLTSQNADISAADRIELRIGVNVGDVIIEDDDLYGDGVNIASRLEELATVGGICISGTAYDQVAGKTVDTFDFLGEQNLKIGRAHV